MTDALVGAVVGAAIAVVGGFFASVYLQQREATQHARRTRDELIAAIRLVRYELSWNATAAKELISDNLEILPLQMRDANYRSVQLTLIRHLPQAHRELLAKAYESMPLAVTNLAALQRRGGGTAVEIGPINRIGDLMAQANQALAGYLTDGLKVEL